MVVMATKTSQAFWKSRSLEDDKALLHKVGAFLDMSWNEFPNGIPLIAKIQEVGKVVRRPSTSEVGISDEWMKKRLEHAMTAFGEGGSAGSSRPKVG